MSPARCELCRFATPHAETCYDEQLVRNPLRCTRIVDGVAPAPAVVIKQPYGDPEAEAFLAVAPTFCCALFEAKP